MNSTIINIISLVCVTGILFCFYILLYKIPKAIKRNNDVARFRKWVLANYPLSVYMELPDYEAMLHDGKKLTLESYIDLPRMQLINDAEGINQQSTNKDGK